jgi:hypothetical protein
VQRWARHPSRFSWRLCIVTHSRWTILVYRPRRSFCRDSRNHNVHWVCRYPCAIPLRQHKPWDVWNQRRLGYENGVCINPSTRSPFGVCVVRGVKCVVDATVGVNIDPPKRCSIQLSDGYCISNIIVHYSCVRECDHPCTLIFGDNLRLPLMWQY